MGHSATAEAWGCGWARLLIPGRRHPTHRGRARNERSARFFPGSRIGVGEGGGGGSPALRKPACSGCSTTPGPTAPRVCKRGRSRRLALGTAPVERAARTIAELTGAGPVAAREAADRRRGPSGRGLAHRRPAGLASACGKFADRPDRMAALVNADARRRHPCLRRITSDVLNDATDPTVGSPFGDLMDYIEENPEVVLADDERGRVPLFAVTRVPVVWPSRGRGWSRSMRLSTCPCRSLGPTPPENAAAAAHLLRASPTIELTSFAVAAATSKCPPLEPPVYWRTPCAQHGDGWKTPSNRG